MSAPPPRPVLPANSPGVLDPLNPPGSPPPPPPAAPHAKGLPKFPSHCSQTVSCVPHKPEGEPWSPFFPVVVAEVTQPSLGVGYELGRAVALHKPVLCLFRPQSDRGEHPPALASFPSSLRSQSSSPSLGTEHITTPSSSMSASAFSALEGGGWGEDLQGPRDSQQPSHFSPLPVPSCVFSFCNSISCCF